MDKENEKGGRSPFYEKPLFEKEEGLVFPEQIIKKFNGNRFCLQCSSCHGCR